MCVCVAAAASTPARRASLGEGGERDQVPVENARPRSRVSAAEATRLAEKTRLSSSEERTRAGVGRRDLEAWFSGRQALGGWKGSAAEWRGSGHRGWGR